MSSDGLACFRAVEEVGCLHQPVVVNGRHPKGLPDFRWINTVISNLRTSFSGTFHALNFGTNADRYLGAFYNKFNRGWVYHLPGMALLGFERPRGGHGFDPIGPTLWPWARGPCGCDEKVVCHRSNVIV